LAYARLTATGSAPRIALAFQPSTHEGGARVAVAPPLLRPGLERLRVRDEGHLLAYALNPGYGARLAAWQRRHPEVVVHCYLDGGAAALEAPPAAGFQAHPLADEAFLEHLAGCRAYVGSAGFESICEGFYLGKPVLAVPTEGHYEQTLNGWDAERAGAARVGSYDDLDAFWAAPPVPSQRAVRDFRDWVARAAEVVVRLIERAAATRGDPTA
jgi:UDP:flavonoid glycosyltransferase YjiC (YdhE family)